MFQPHRDIHSLIVPSRCGTLSTCRCSTTPPFSVKFLQASSTRPECSLTSTTGTRFRTLSRTGLATVRLDPLYSLHQRCCTIPVATRAMLPSIFSALTRIVNETDPLKLAINGISYKPFISLFNLTEATKTNPEIAGIGTHSRVQVSMIDISLQKITTLWPRLRSATLHRESLLCG